MKFSKIMLFNEVPEFKNNIDQIKKINEELEEVITEFKNRNKENMGQELFDLIQAIWTMIINNYNNDEIYYFQNKLIDKMKERYK